MKIKPIISLAAWALMVMVASLLATDRACAQINIPTSAAPAVVPHVEATDVTIVYQIEPADLAPLSLAYGMYVGLEIFHESATSDPVYRFVDPNVLATEAGESRVLHWNGYTSSSERAPPGKYSVSLSLYNHIFEPAGWSHRQDNAIIIGVCDITIEAASDTYLSRHGAMAGADSLAVHYTLSHAVAFDEVVINVYDADDTLISRSSDTTDLGGTARWDGWTLDRTMAGAGRYQAELVLKRGGTTVGTSPMHPFIVYEVDLQAAGLLESDEESPGLFLPAGQETAITLRFRPEASGLDGTIRLEGISGSDAIQFEAAGVPLDLAAGTDVLLAAAETGFVFTSRSTHLHPDPVQLVAEYQPSAAPLSKKDFDKIILVPSGMDLDVDADRDGTVEESEEDDIGEDTWQIGAGNKGAIVLVNSDDDDNDNLPDNWSVHPDITHGIWDSEPFDNSINADPDVQDIAPLIARKVNLAAFPDDASITLRVEVPPDDPAYFSGFSANERIRIFYPNQVSGSDHVFAAGAPEMIGPELGDRMEFVALPGPAQRDIAIFLGEGDVKFGIEGIVHSALVDVILEYREGADLYCRDRVRIRTAPFILFSHVKAVETAAGAGETVFVEDWYGSDEIRPALDTQFGAGHVDKADTDDVWHQDGYDPGYQAAPYKSMPMILGLPRGQRGSDNLNQYAQNELMRPDVGLVHRLQYLPLGGGGEGGNLEAIPGAAQQFLHGSHMQAGITDFLAAQDVQREMAVDTSFLVVGHVDELVSYAPDGRHVLVSSPETAWALLLIAAGIDEDAIMLQGIEPLDAAGATVRTILTDYEDYNFDVVLDPFHLPRFRQDLGLGSAAGPVQADPHNTGDPVLIRAGGLIGFMDGNQIRTFRLTFTGGTDFSCEFRDGEGSWVSDGSGQYGNPFISNSKTAFILDRWWQSGTPVAGDICTFTVNPRTACVEVPVIFRSIGGRALAFTNNNVNSLISADTIITARTAGPVVDWGAGAHDIFAYYLERIFARAGYAHTIFADETSYHNRYGSIHCGTNVLRKIPSRHWWE